MDKSVYTQLITLLEEWMKKAISAADANRRFSPLLRDVREGQSYVVTEPPKTGREHRSRQPADRLTAARVRNSLLKRLRHEPAVDIGRWKRDEL